MPKIVHENTAAEQVIFSATGSDKRCPFFSTVNFRVGECIKEKCMLWNEEKQTCNINVIAESKR